MKKISLNRALVAKKKIFTLVAAFMAVSAFAIETEVLNVNYAQAAEGLGYGMNSGNIVQLVRNTTTKYSACGQTVYPFSITFEENVVVAENDVMVNRGDGGLRYNSIRNIGFYDNNKLNYYGIKNVLAGDIVEIAYNGGGDNNGMKEVPALTVDNAVLDEAAGTYSFPFNYGGKDRTLDYTVRQFTVSADGIVGFYMQGAYIAYIKVTRDIEESAFTLETIVDYANGVTAAGTLVAEGAAVIDYTSKYNSNSTSCTVITLPNSYSSTKDGVTTHCYVEVSVEGGFKAGDSLTIQPFTSMSTSDFTGGKKYANIELRPVTGDVVGSAVNLTGSAAGALTVTDGHEEAGEPKTFGYVLPADCDKFRLARQGGTRINILSFSVIRRTLNDPGTTTAVENTQTIKNGIMYNILGQQVDENYKGIVILDGKKILRR